MSEQDQEVTRQMEDDEAESGTDVVQSGGDESGSEQTGEESGSGDQAE